MKKKVVMLLFCISLSVLAVGCGAQEENKDSQNTNDDSNISSDTDISNEESEIGDISDLDSLGDIEAEEGLFDVEITIPADFVSVTTQEELDEMASEEGYKSAILNSDGSATYVMTKAQHKKMMSDITKGINEDLQGMVGSEEYPNFTKVEANSDYTEFTVTTTSTELDLVESFSVINLYIQGGLYNVVNCTPADNISVTFVNDTTGEVIEVANSSDIEE